MGEEEHPPIQEQDLGLKVQERLSKHALEYGYVVHHSPGQNGSYKEIGFVMNRGNKSYEFSMNEFSVDVRVLENDSETEYMISEYGIDEFDPPPTALHENPILAKMWGRSSRPVSDEKSKSLFKELLLAEPDPAATEEDFKENSSYAEFDGSITTWAKEQPQLPFKLPFPEPHA